MFSLSPVALIHQIAASTSSMSKWILILVPVYPSNFMPKDQPEHLLTLCVYSWGFFERSVLRYPASGSLPPDLCSLGSYLHATRWIPLGSRISPHVKLYGGETSFDSLSDLDRHISKISMQHHYHAIPGAPFSCHCHRKETLSWHAYTRLSSSCYLELYSILGALGFCNKRLHLKIRGSYNFLRFSSFLGIHFFQLLTMYQLHRSIILPKEDNMAF